MRALPVASVLFRAVLASGLVALPGAVLADTPHRVRGTVANIDGRLLTVKSREGVDVTINLADGWNAGGVAAANLSNIRIGDFVGVASIPDKNNGDDLEALELVIFPEAMRGTGEGHREWDLAPGSRMTNATVVAKVDGVKGQTLTLSYKGGERRVVVPPTAPVVTFVPASPADVKAGSAVFVPAQRKDDGSLVANRVLVGKDGVVPPM